ncbi:hypothetical protein ABZW18_08880 [Streptomyces sp. NPDC004647]|uniref:hypothetical protein n=1 Tax=Streptomyces sp. NPDC004647 TaxID=3154671 RepID=UPI00339E8940
MQRGLVHAAAWSLATGAAVTLSWWGVHTVLAGTAYDPPRALPIPSDATALSEADGGAQPRSSSTRRPKPSPTSSSPKPSGTSGHKDTRPPRSPAPSAAPATVKSYTVPGGRVVLDLGKYSASLVSATPDTGWRMQVWKQSEWIRVDFTSGGRASSVFCTWNGHPPTVQRVPG